MLVKSVKYRNRDKERQRAKEFNSILAIFQPQFARMNRAVFLDRDGTLIVEKDYLRRPEDVEIFPATPPGLKRLGSSGFSGAM